MNDSKSYVGITDDVYRRLREHNSGKHSYTKRYMPWDLIYTEELTSIEEARKREKYYKSTTGRRALKRLFNRI
jgi:putative endonuclease